MVDPVEIALSEDRSVEGPTGVLGHGLNGRGTSTVNVGRSRDCGKRCVRREARMDRHGRAVLQRRRGLDVEAADVEEWQHGEDVIAGGEAVHVLAHHGVPQ